jgi:hypothetical protein
MAHVNVSSTIWPSVFTSCWFLGSRRPLHIFFWTHMRCQSVYLSLLSQIKCLKCLKNPFSGRSESRPKILRGKKTLFLEVPSSSLGPYAIHWSHVMSHVLLFTRCWGRLQEKKNLSKASEIFILPFCRIKSTFVPSCRYNFTCAPAVTSQGILTSMWIPDVYCII